MVIVLLSGEQVNGLVSISTVQVYSVLLSDGTTLCSINVLLLLTIAPSELVQFMIIPLSDETFTHCIVTLYPSDRSVKLSLSSLKGTIDQLTKI